MPLRPAALAVAACLLAGCMGVYGPTTGPQPGPTPIRSFVASLPDPAAPWGYGLQYVLEASKETNVTALFASSEADRPDQAVWACGFLTLRKVENGTLGPAFGRSFSYSGGHALVVAQGGRPFVANDTRAGENLFLAINETTDGGVRLRSGQQVVIETAYQANAGSAQPPIRAAFNLTADGPLRLARTVPFWFRCGANLEGFQGSFAAEGFSAGAVYVKEATATIEATMPTRAFFAVYQDTRFLASSCSTALLLDGAVLEESGPQANSDCVLRAQPGAGRITLRIADSVM
ncbi:MAG: hypothetical protein LC623_09045, partial [Halobacteriales archaeon]|nr:hypothetical protein [Halobacteriales archaeon]